MSLQKQVIPINFDKGLNQKVDSKLVIPSDLLELENAVFTKYGALNKRFGYESLSTQIQGGGNIIQGEALGVFNEELNLYTGKKLYAYTESTNRWIDKGNMVSTIVSDTPILKNGYAQANISCDTLDDITVYAWEDSRGGVRCSVLDQTSNTTYVFDTLLNVDGARCKVVAFDPYIVIFYRKTSNTSLRYKYISKNSPTVLSSEGTVATDLNATYNYDAVANVDFIDIVYHNNANEISIRSMSNVFAVSGATTLAEDPTDCITAIVDPTQRLWIAFSDGTDVKLTVYSYLLAVLLAPTVIETIADIVNITGCINEDTIDLYYTKSAAVTYNYLIRKNTCAIDGTVGTAAEFKRSVSLASKAFYYNGKCYLNVIHSSELQSTYFTISEDGNVIAKMSQGTAGDIPDNTLLTTIPFLSDTSVLFARQEKTAILSEDNTIFSQEGIYTSELEFSSENKFQNSQLGQLHIVGGILQSYDGASVTEHNFHLYPENVTAVDAGGGGSIANGTYQYSVCYEWTDNLGQIHKSIPSTPVSVTTIGGSSTVTVTIPTLRLTAKTDTRAPVRIVVYRTQDLGTLFYRVSSIVSPTYNSTTADKVTFSDTLADATIIANDLLYTTGSVLESEAPPASALITTFKNRVFLSGLPDPLQIWYSKKRTVGIPVEFSSFFSMRVDSYGGDITAIGAMDGNLLIFKRNAIFALSGDGPNDLGQQTDYGDAQLVTSDAGCDNPNTIVMTPDGLMFKSSKGVYLINRSLEVSYIGANVEDFNGYIISGSALVPDTNQIRFTTEDSTTLMYDYYFKQWGTFTNQQAEDCQIWNGKFLYLKSSGIVNMENEGFQDVGSPIVMKITTSWLSFAGVQGFQRVWRMIFLGEYKSAHKINVAVGYNFSPSFSQFAQIDISDVYQITAYGEDSPYGAGSPYGGAYPLYQFKTHLTKQKCQSLRFSFYDSQEYLSVAGEGFNMCNIALEVGIKPTIVKNATANTFATGTS